jgi:hypothetical protein
MPRPRLNAPAPQLSHGQAAYVLERLIADRRISPGEVSRYVSDMHREISDLETRLQTLRTHAGASTGTGTAAGMSSGAGFGARRGRPPGRPPGRPAGIGVTASGKRRGRPPGSKNVASSASAASSGAAAAPAAGKRRRRARITPEQLASRQLQGRYLGLIRQIPANKRGQYQKIAKDSGREAAINAMKSAVNR